MHYIKIYRVWGFIVRFFILSKVFVCYYLGEPTCNGNFLSNGQMSRYETENLMFTDNLNLHTRYVRVSDGVFIYHGRATSRMF